MTTYPLRRRLALLPALALMLLSATALAAAPSPAARQEIDHLLAHLKSSGCEFSRNGSWYGADEAMAHLSRKYDYLLQHGLVASAEDFIARAATESSMSGKPYLVRCAAQAPEPSGPWFRAALARYRAGRR